MFFNFVSAPVFMLKAEREELILSRDYDDIHRNQNHFSDLPTRPASQSTITAL